MNQDPQQCETAILTHPIGITALWGFALILTLTHASTTNTKYHSNIQQNTNTNINITKNSACSPNYVLHILSPTNYRYILSLCLHYLVSELLITDISTIDRSEFVCENMRDSPTPTTVHDQSLWQSVSARDYPLQHQQRKQQ